MQGLHLSLLFIEGVLKFSELSRFILPDLLHFQVDSRLSCHQFLVLGLQVHESVLQFLYIGEFFLSLALARAATLIPALLHYTLQEIVKFLQLFLLLLLPSQVVLGVSELIFQLFDLLLLVFDNFMLVLEAGLLLLFKVILSCDLRDLLFHSVDHLLLLLLEFVLFEL